MTDIDTRLNGINDRLNNVFQKKLDQLEADATVLKSVVTKSANPSPILITVIVLIVIAVIYFIMRPCITGKWVDSNGVAHKIYKSGGEFKVDIKNKTYPASVEGNYVSYGSTAGIWNYKDKIILLGKDSGMYLTRN